MGEGGTNLRLGYSSEYCWIQMWPKGKGGASLVLNAAKNSVGFGTTRPLTNIPGSGSSAKFHVDGNLLVTGNLIVKGQVSSGQAMMEDATSLLEVSEQSTGKMLDDIEVDLHDDGKLRFAETDRHQGAISISHVAAVLTRTLQHHQAELDDNESLLKQHTSMLDALSSKVK